MFRIIIFLFPCLLFSSFFEETIAFAKSGDFVIYEQGKTASMLIINQIDKDRLVLEEICFPSYLKSKIQNPQKWVEEQAKGHTSWRIYELDRKDFSLVEAYSYDDSGHLILNNHDFFLSKLLNLNLEKVPPSLRRKIGTKKKNQPDTRKLWNPSIFTLGKKEKPECEAYTAVWGKDGSELSEKTIELYFAKDQSFFFPYWLEVEAAKTSFSIRVINSGNYPFKAKLPPKRRPYFTRKPLIQKNSIELSLQIPKYYQKFSLEVLDLTKSESTNIPIKSLVEINEEQVLVKIDAKDFEKNHPYKIILIPENQSDIKTEITFLFDN